MIIGKTFSSLFYFSLLLLLLLQGESFFNVLLLLLLLLMLLFLFLLLFLWFLLFLLLFTVVSVVLLLLLLMLLMLLLLLLLLLPNTSCWLKAGAWSEIFHSFVIKHKLNNLKIKMDKKSNRMQLCHSLKEYCKALCKSRVFCPSLNCLTFLTVGEVNKHDPNTGHLK